MVLGLLTLGACQRDDDTNAPEAFREAGWPLVDVPGEPGYVVPDAEAAVEIDDDDVEIAKDVAATLRGDPMTRDEPILVAAQDAVVQLSGRVSTLQVVRRAIDLAESTPDVATVTSAMTVDVPGRSDVAVGRDVERELVDEPAVDAHEVGVHVDDGQVRLIGVVDSATERMIAEYIAAGVRGVLAIDNQLQVSTPLRRPPDEVAIEDRRRRELLGRQGSAIVGIDRPGPEAGVEGR